MMMTIEKNKFYKLGLIVFLASVAATRVSFAAEIGSNHSPFVLEIGYTNRAPFSYEEGKQAQGFLIHKIRTALKSAKIPFRFTQMSQSHGMMELKAPRNDFAFLGLIKTPERASFAVFSEPIYRDQNPILIVRASDKSKFARYKTFETMTAKSHLSFCGKESAAYPIDAQLRKMKSRDRRFIGDSAALVGFMIANRCDFTLAYPEEFPFILASPLVDSEKVSEYRYPDLPAGGFRYLAFTKSVPNSLIERINDALANTHDSLNSSSND